MKNFKYIFIFLSVIAFSSCEDLDINDNPNNVSETHPDLLLTNIITTAFQVQGTGAMYASRMIVQTDGENTSQFYKWDRASFNDYNNLRQVTKMMEEAERISDDSYIGIGYFFRAYYFYNLALTFGDVPYAEALKGETEGLYQPSYSTQEEVFVGILNELEEANSLLDETNIITGDPIFNGDVSKWKKLVNSFRLKILLTLSNKEGNSSIDIKSQFASIYNSEDIISASEESARLEFVDVVNSRYTEFNSSSYGSGLYMASTFVDMLKEREDPRLFAIAGQTKNAKEAGLSIDDFSSYAGGNPVVPYNEVNLLAAAGEVSKVNDRYTADPTAEAHNLLSFSEVQFILAEAAVRGWISTANAQTFYENGIKANFNFYNTYAKGYEAYYTETEAAEYIASTAVNFANVTTDAEKLNLILTQKYLTSFLQGGWRMYFDHLRTGYPAFPLGVGTAPTRWIYPLDEYNNNSENVTEAITRQFGASNDGIRELTWWLK
ncbi:SusD/RagB family nutrient-binding outer membrane lipoprotein [Polaribacter sargassicola]|uniref:SusD/RagB family nutrient-binding outer membrane lipoprotein n=1 Tax=Polaribacter sargassicola TaxID=2836891 RepID=UPI001F18ED69|nr:SusD/RagB family nutrient-binding outer membrane lipoprotein [Polaribacter sp. DS7-9]MCG1036593.1 SusD/RagB family nutrient-binding outer membrane lipoprotein [Polaribacter sp. DS7-9]